MIGSIHDESEYAGQSVQRVVDGCGDRLKDPDDTDVPSKVVKITARCFA